MDSLEDYGYGDSQCSAIWPRRIGGYEQSVNVFSSDSTSLASIWAYRRLATAPPAEWPVMTSEQFAHDSSSCRSDVNRAATGWIILRATERKPLCTWFPGSSYGECRISTESICYIEWAEGNSLTKKPAGDAGVDLRLTVQSVKVWLPLMAKTMQLRSLMCIDLITMAFVPIRVSASMCVSRSTAVGLI